MARLETATDETLGLAPQHATLIAASAISSEVAGARGYRSIMSEKELADLGFSKAQRLSGLVFPVRDVNGTIAFYQLRPDKPRLAKNGEAIKYETPYGAALVVDAPPAGCSSLAHEKEHAAHSGAAETGDAEIGSTGKHPATARTPRNGEP
jgi:hypothetical protein